MSSSGDGEALPAIEILVRFPGSCRVLSPGSRVVYRKPEILKDLSDRLCAQALLSLIPAADALANSASDGGLTEIAEAHCSSPGCGAIFSLRALEPGALDAAPEGAREPPHSPAQSRRITRALSKIDDDNEQPFLSRLEPDLVQEIADLSLVSVYDSPAVVISEGHEGQALYIVGEGELEVVRYVDDKEIVLATLHKGECFGEISLLTGQPTNATVKTKGNNTAVLVLSRESLEELLLRRRALHREFSRIVAFRLYRTNVALEAETHRGINGRLSMIGIIDLIQTLHASRRTGTLEVDNEQGQAIRLGFINGELMGAAMGDLIGAEAVYEILEWQDGYFSFEGGEPSFSGTPGAEVSGGTMGLLMEGLRRIDERNKGR